MKMRITMILAVVMMAGIGSGSLKAQEWSQAQKDVWKNVNDYWALMAKGDINGFLEYFDKDYLGWDNDSPLPSSKDETKKWLQYSFQGAKIPVYELKPVGIKIHGDFAFVHYYYSYVKEMDGKKSMESGRWTDILMKVGDKWVMIGDHGGSDKKQ
jgi:ketosteroid isomerase-like protein